MAFRKKFQKKFGVRAECPVFTGKIFDTKKADERVNARRLQSNKQSSVMNLATKLCLLLALSCKRVHNDAKISKKLVVLG